MIEEIDKDDTRTIDLNSFLEMMRIKMIKF
jgi:Ca2+-binding EF-hand superfamily protein